MTHHAPLIIDEKSSIIIPIVSILIILIILSGIHRNDCYYFHVAECEDCHKQGGDFMVCSGFCIKPKSDPIIQKDNNTLMVDPSPCRVNLNESCKDNIAHGCNLPENEYVDGWCFPFTELCWWF